MDSILRVVKNGKFLLIIVLAVLMIIACRKPTGSSPVDIQPDKTLLYEKILLAWELYDSVMLSADGTDIPTDEYWVVSKWSLFVAIQTAQEIYDDPDASQWEIETALEELINAYNKINNEKMPGLFENPDEIISGSIIVVFTEPQDETITLTGAQTLDWIENTVLQISVAESFDSYQWYVNGTIQTGETGSSLILYARNLFLGTNTVTLRVTKGVIPYTKTLTFDVN